MAEHDTHDDTAPDGDTRPPGDRPGADAMRQERHDRTAAKGDTRSGDRPGADAKPEETDDGGIAAAVRDLVRTVVTSVGRAGTVSLSALGDAVEASLRALAGRVAARAVAQPKPVADRAELAAALDEQPRSPLLGGVTGAAVVAKVAKRFGPVRFLARRTPTWLVITAVPAVHASVARGAEELALVSSHLVHRARDAGVEPDPDRVRRAAVQLVSGGRVDPGAEPRHAPLALAWLQRALRATLPFSPGVATRDPGALARAAAAVDPSTLSPDREQRSWRQGTSVLVTARGRPVRPPPRRPPPPPRPRSPRRRRWPPW